LTSSESLKARAARPRGDGVLAAETMVDLEKQIDSPEYDYGTVWRDGLVNLPSNIAGLFSAQRQQILRPETKSVVETPTGGFFEVPNPAVHGPVERGPGIESPVGRGIHYLSRLISGDLATERQTAETVGRGLAALPQGVTKMVRDFPRTAAGMTQTAEKGVPTVAYDYDAQGRPIEGTGAPPVMDPFLVMGMGAPQMAATKLGMIDSSLGVFGSRNAPNLSPALREKYDAAEKMLDKGESPPDVEKATGLAVIRLDDPDAERRFSQRGRRSERFAVRHHIPDDEMMLHEQGLVNLIESDFTTPHRLEDVMNHPKLYEAYPDLRNVEIAMYPGESRRHPHGMTAKAEWHRDKNLIKLNQDHHHLSGSEGDDLPGPGSAEVENYVRSILHEVSHAVQGKDPKLREQVGYASGSGGPASEFSKATDELLKRHPDLKFLAGYSPRSNFELAQRHRDNLHNEIIRGWKEIEALDLSGTANPVTLKSEMAFQRGRLEKKLGDRDQETFFPAGINVYRRNKLEEQGKARDNWRRGATRDDETKFHRLQLKIQELVDLENSLYEADYRYFTNLGEMEARATEMMRGYGPDDPYDPVYQFNKVFATMRSAGKEDLGKNYYPDIDEFLQKRPKTASGHDINTAFGLGRMKSPRPPKYNKGGYVMTGAETMMGLD